MVVKIGSLSTDRPCLSALSATNITLSVDNRELDAALNMGTFYEMT